MKQTSVVIFLQLIATSQPFTATHSRCCVGRISTISEMGMTGDKDGEESSEISKSRREKLKEWIRTRRNKGDKKVEHIQVPNRDSKDDVFDAGRSTMEDVPLPGSDDISPFQIDSSERVPDWLREKQEAAAAKMKQLEQSIVGETDAPQWLEERQEELTRNIRQKQKELFTKAARGEMYVPGFSTLYRDDSNEEDEPEWVTEQKQTMETDSWIRRKMEENILEDKRKELKSQSEKEILDGTPDWFKQKEAEMMAKLEQIEKEASAAAMSDQKAEIMEEMETIDDNADNMISIEDDGNADEDLSDDWFRRRESTLKESTQSSSEETVVVNEGDAIPDWLKQKEQEMMQKLQSMENENATKSEQNLPKEPVSNEQRRQELMEVVSSYNPVDAPTKRSIEKPLRDDKPSSNLPPPPPAEQKSTDSSLPDTPFFRDNVDNEIEPVNAGENMGRNRPSVMDYAPDWLVKETETKKRSPDEDNDSRDAGDDFDDGYSDEDLDKEFEESYMFRDPSVDWIRSDPREARIEKSSTFSNFQYRYDQMLESDRTLSVGELNTLFEEDGNLLKLQARNQPDCAYGAIFRLEGALIDTTKLQMAAWTKVAEKFDFNPPFPEEVAAAQMMPPDQAIRRAFYWTQDMLDSREMAMEHYDALQEVFDDVIGSKEDSSEDAYMNNFPVTEGALEWLQNLTEVDLPCCVISNLDRNKLDSVLNMTSLDSFFPENRRISANDGYDEQEQEYLGAALRNMRRPDHCVVFEATPEAAASAHEVDMRAIALMGLYAMYELRTADMVVENYDGLSVIDIRRLFWDVNYEPEIQLERVAVLDDKPKRIKRWVDWDYEY